MLVKVLRLELWPDKAGYSIFLAQIQALPFSDEHQRASCRFQLSLLNVKLLCDHESWYVRHRITPCRWDHSLRPEQSRGMLYASVIGMLDGRGTYFYDNDTIPFRSASVSKTSTCSFRRAGARAHTLTR